MSDGFDGCKFCRQQALHVVELEERVRDLEARLAEAMKAKPAKRQPQRKAA